MEEGGEEMEKGEHWRKRDWREKIEDGNSEEEKEE